MKEILMIGALLPTIGIKQGASVAAHCGAVGEVNAARLYATPTAASSGVALTT